MVGVHVLSFQHYVLRVFAADYDLSRWVINPPYFRFILPAGCGGGQVGVDGGYYPFTAPVKPRMNCFCNNKKKMIIGTTVITTPAAVPRESLTKAPCNATSPTCKVLFVKVGRTREGQKKLFHCSTKVMIATVARVGRTTGMTIFHQILNSLAPSIRPASSRSSGTPLNACLRRKILNTVAI